MKKRSDKRPSFSTEAQEAAFWDAHDSTDYVDWSKATRAEFPNLKPSTHTIAVAREHKQT